MNVLKHKLTLEMTALDSQVTVRIKKDDTKNRLIISLSENGKPYEITKNLRAVFVGKKPDGKIVFNDCDIVGNTIEYTITAQTSVAVGIVACELRLYDANAELLTSPRFTIVVDEIIYNPNDVQIESENEIGVLDSLIEEINILQANIGTAIHLIDSYANGNLGVPNPKVSRLTVTNRADFEGEVSVQEPTADDNPATKKYVDNAVANLPTDSTGVEKTKINADGELVITYSDGNSVNLGKVVGANGISITNAVVDTSGELILTFSNGQRYSVGYVLGTNGIGIEKTEINADGELIVTYTGDNSANLGKVVGADGAQGPQGIQGIQGETGAKGDKGDKGEKGDKGDPYTLNEADKAEIVAAAEAVCVAKNQGASNVGKILVVGTDGNLTLTDMPEGGVSGDVIGVLDESNNILLSGNLADGTYTLKYENEDGTYTDIGTLEVGAIPEPEPQPTNFFVVGGDGYLNPGRAASNGTDRTDVPTCLLTNYIQVQNGDEIYAYNAKSSNASVGLMGLYKEDKTGVGFYVRNNATYISNVSMSDEVDVFTINYDGVAYMRVCCLIPSDLNTIVINIKRNGKWL